MASADRKRQRAAKINFSQLVVRDQKFLVDNVNACGQALDILDLKEMKEDKVSKTKFIHLDENELKQLKDILTQPENVTS